MDVYGLKNYIINNHEYIEVILEKAGFYNITYRNEEYRCAREEGRNPTSVKVNKNTLAATSYSTNRKGDLITLVQAKLNITFPKTLKLIADIIEYKDTEQVEKVIPPFGGYYKKIARLRSDNGVELNTYSDEILLQYEIAPNLLFFDDGILPSIQQEFNVGYDSVSGRITVPWRSFSGEICGIMGRLNKKELEDNDVKWMPIYEFPKSKVIYGYVQNYYSILEKKIVMLGESEKFTMQLKSKGIDVGLSLGGCFLSEIQANHIKSMFPETILIMLDEGISQEHSYNIANQLKSDKYYKNNVGYVFDKNNQYLPRGSKLAPSDLDKKTLNNIVKNCVIWI
jgi:DNA primase